MTKKQERARARRRWEKRQVALVQQEKRRARYKKYAAITAVVILVAFGLGWLGTQVLAERSAKEAKAEATSSASPSTSVSLPPGCTSPPPSLGTAGELTLPDKALANNATWVATITTNCGDIVMELDGAKAPQAVASFVQLARADYWLNSPCHRMVSSATMSILQCGDPTGSGSGGPGYGYGVENAPADGVYPRGSVAMARTNDPTTGNGGQFFIIDQETTIADPNGYTIFGTVTQGLDIVDTVIRAGVAGSGTTATDGAPKVPISILRVAVTEKKA